MKTSVLKLTHEAFDPYGSFLLPQTTDRKTDPIEFHADLLVSLSEFSPMAALSTLSVSKRPLVVDLTEKHFHTEEVFGGYSCDTLFHVAAPSDRPDPEQVRVFLLPAGGFVRVKREVWHHAPFVLGVERATGLVWLPPYTYTHDCFVYDLPTPVEIELD